MASARALKFDRVELAGAFGDLGTLLPIVVAMIFINKLSPSSVFLTFGVFYLVTGQPLKAVGAIAIAYPAVITESAIGASGIIFQSSSRWRAQSLKTNEEYFVALLIAGIALAVPDMDWAFGAGIAVALLIRKFKVKI